LLLAALGSPARADSDAAKQYQALVKEFDDAQQKSLKAYREAKTPEAQTKIREELSRQLQEYMGKFIELADKHPKDAAAVDALIWVVQHGFGPDSNKALERLADQRPDDKRLSGLVQRLGYSQSPAAEKILKAQLAKNPDRTVRGQAALGLAQMFKTKAEQSNGPDAEHATRNAEKYYELVAEKYADVNYRNRTLADVAKGALFEMRHLSIGKPAPEITGEDTDGKKFKLSDYKGKVVLLDFWGNW
jgi:hypothetical protein